MRRYSTQERDAVSVTVPNIVRFLFWDIQLGTRVDWSLWQPPALPELPNMWPYAPWRRPIDASFVEDTAATDGFADLGRHLPRGTAYNPTVRAHTNLPSPNARHGIPYQRVDGAELATVWNYTNPQWGPRAWRLPLPQPIRRYQDPVPPISGDMQSYLVDGEGGRYWELSAFGPTPRLDQAVRESAREFPDDPPSGWQAAACAEFDLTQPWDQRTVFDHPVGIAGGRTPILPKTVRRDEFARGYIDHAIDIAIGGLSPHPPVGYARSTDGPAAFTGSPIRAGHLIQIHEHRYHELMEGATRDAQTLLTGLFEYGALVNDMTSPGAGHELRVCQSAAVNLGGLTLTARDFRVLVPN